MSPRYYANPYNLEHTGFYFWDLESFEQQRQQSTLEELMIDFIDGDNPALFAAASINTRNLTTWFEQLEHLSDCDDQAIALRYLLDLGYTLNEALFLADDVQLWHGSATDYASELINDCYDMNTLPELIRSYIDYEAIARDMALNGEMVACASNCWVVNALSF